MSLKSWSVMSYIGLLALFPLTADAHSRLLSSEPGNHQILTQAPGHISLKFSTPVEVKFSQLELARGNEKNWQALKVKGAGRSLQAELPPLTPAKYRVRWSVLSSDGHVQNGQFSFELH